MNQRKPLIHLWMDGSSLPRVHAASSGLFRSSFLHVRTKLVQANSLMFARTRSITFEKITGGIAPTS